MLAEDLVGSQNTTVAVVAGSIATVLVALIAIIPALRRRETGPGGGEDQRTIGALEYRTGKAEQRLDDHGHQLDQHEDAITDLERTREQEQERRHDGDGYRG